MKCIQTPLCASKSKNGDSKITHTFAHLLNAHIHLFRITVRISPNAIPISQPDFFVGFFSGDFLSHSMFRTSEVIQCMWFWYWNEWIKMKIRWSRWFEMPTEQNAADSCETWKLHVFKITGLLRFCVLAKWAYQV